MQESYLYNAIATFDRSELVPFLATWSTTLHHRGTPEVRSITNKSSTRVESFSNGTQRM